MKTKPLTFTKKFPGVYVFGSITIRKVGADYSGTSYANKWIAKDDNRLDEIDYLPHVTNTLKEMKQLLLNTY